MQKRNICPSCGGSGELATSHRFTCYSCDGKGHIDDPVLYAKVLEEERQMGLRRDARLTADEYRQMGG